MKRHPKVSIVTACYNSEEYLEDCILSVMRQTYNNVEHIIVDGGSQDRTVEIIKKYEGKYNMRWVSEKDNGMYDAITKGFLMASGDILAWLNSDDMYMPWACELVAIVMVKTGIQWCTGIPCHYNERGIAHNVPRITPVFPRSFIRKGYMDGRVATFLEQESMFWSKALWNKAGSVLAQYKIAGDYHLWKEFANYESLYTLDSVISGFRIHDGQKSGDRKKYYDEVGGYSFRNKLLAKTKLVSGVLFFNAILNGQLRLKTRVYLLGSKREENDLCEQKY